MAKLKNRKFLFIVLSAGALFSFFYSVFFSYNFREFTRKLDHVHKVSYFELPQKDTYLIKVWFSKDITSRPVKVSLNSQPLVLYQIKERDKTEELFFVVPQEVSNKGLNKLELYDVPDNFTSSVRVSNYYSKSKSRRVSASKPNSNGVFILFDSSALFKGGFLKLGAFLIGIIFFFWLIIGYYALFDFLLKRYFRLSLDKFTSSLLLPVALLFLLFLVFLTFTAVTPFRIILSTNIFFGLLVLVSFLNVAMIAFNICKDFPETLENAASVARQDNPFLRSNVLINYFRPKLHFKAAPLAFYATFLKQNLLLLSAALFTALLTACAVFYALGFEPMDAFFANIAYITLAMGFAITVIISFVSGK
ncbi:MAG: hypothetical protein AB1481_02520 [Candidatus Omnitrophota bacterium]